MHEKRTGYVSSITKKGRVAMFWDKISPLYDLFENVYNGKVYSSTGEKVAEMIEASDVVLECACGTGAISRYIAPKCKRLIATDFSTGMLRQASRKCGRYGNVTFRKADITSIKCRDALRNSSHS